MKTIDLDEIIARVQKEHNTEINYEQVIDCMTEAIRQALEIAAEEATAKIGYESDTERLIDYKVARVDKKSILNVIDRVR